VMGEDKIFIFKFGSSEERDQACALKAVRRIRPRGHYLGDPFALKRFKDAFASRECLTN
jgi:trimethylamine:corrinoid methyltransferase-like protein